MSEEKDKGFKVTDRRASAQQPEAAPHEVKAGEEVQGPGWKMKEAPAGLEAGGPGPQVLPKMDFTTFCLSLASSAMIHLGLSPSPESGKTEQNLSLAKQTIDILVLLEEKTKGNLTAEEAKLLGAVLYDLRVRFVEMKK